jgi:hypothetical protein
MRFLAGLFEGAQDRQCPSAFSRYSYPLSTKDLPEQSVIMLQFSLQKILN